MGRTRLEIAKKEVAVGDLKLEVRGMTLRQAEALADAVKELDLGPIAKAVRPAIEAAGTADIAASLGASSENILEALVALARSAAGSASHVAGILLDNLSNYTLLKEEYPEMSDPEKAAKFGVYLTSDDLRDWVNLVIQPSQAVEVIKAAVELSDLGSVGKALMSAVGQATDKLPKPTVPEPTMTQ